MCLSKGWLKVFDGQGHVRAKSVGDEVQGHVGVSGTWWKFNYYFNKWV